MHFCQYINQTVLYNKVWFFYQRDLKRMKNIDLMQTNEIDQLSLDESNIGEKILVFALISQVLAFFCFSIHLTPSETINLNNTK